jgi:hypothetical protein
MLQLLGPQQCRQVGQIAGKRHLDLMQAAIKVTQQQACLGHLNLVAFYRTPFPHCQPIQGDQSILANDWQQDIPLHLIRSPHAQPEPATFRLLPINLQQCCAQRDRTPGMVQTTRMGRHKPPVRARLPGPQDIGRQEPRRCPSPSMR